MGSKRRSMLWGKKANGGISQKGKSLTFDDLRFYVFKHSVVYSSLLYSSSLRIDKEDKDFLTTEQPIVKGFFDTLEDGMESVFRADSLGTFLEIQQLKASVHSPSKKFTEVDTIPMPPYVPRYFLDELEIAVEEACNFSSDKKAEMIRKGHKIFVIALTSLKNNVYPKLFSFLKNTNVSRQEEKREGACNAYSSFLATIQGNSDLFYFCKWLNIDPLLHRLKNKHFRVKPKPTSSMEEISKKTRLQKFREFLESGSNTFFSLLPKDLNNLSKKNTLFAPIGFSSDYSYKSSEVFGTSSTDLILHYLPLLENLNTKLDDSDKKQEDKEDWNYIVSVLDVQSFFAYKQKRALQKKQEILASIRKLDKESLRFQDRLNEDIELSDINRNLNNVELSHTLISLIEAQVKMFSFDLEDSARKRLKVLLSKDYFRKQGEQEQVISILNAVRLSFYDFREGLPKIDNEFYVNIRNAKIKKALISIIQNLVRIYQQDLIARGVTSRDRKIATIKTENRKTENNTREEDDTSGYDYEEEAETKEDVKSDTENDKLTAELFGD